MIGNSLLSQNYERHRSTFGSKASWLGLLAAKLRYIKGENSSTILDQLSSTGKCGCGVNNKLVYQNSGRETCGFVKLLLQQKRRNQS